MTAYTIMIHVGTRAWTVETLHSACVLARRTDAEIALVKMLPVQHLGWLGTEFGNLSFTEQVEQELRDYALTLEDYGVPYSVNLMQYVTLIDALVQAAGHLKAQVVFAQIPGSIIPYWHRFQTAMLRRLLARQYRQFFDRPAVLPELPEEEPARVAQP